MKKNTYFVKTGAILLSCAMMFGMTACGNGSGTNSSGANDAGADTSGDKIIVGTEAGFAPYEYMEGNNVVGIDMDLAQAIADAMGKELEIKNMDFDGALLAVQQGKVDFVAAGVSITPERLKNMDFSDNYVDSTDVIVVNADSPAVSGADDLKGKVIGVQQGNVADLWCSNTKNVEAKEVKRYTAFAQAAQDLMNQKIDCIVMDKVPAKELIAATDGMTILEGEENIVFQDQYAIAVQKGNRELVEQINGVLSDLKETGKLEEIIAKYADDSEK